MFSKRFLSGLVLLFAVSLIAACASALYIPTESEATTNASLKDLNDGRTAYINKCGGCHTLFVPDKYTAKDWNTWVDRMEDKAKITSEEKEKILKYLTKGK